MREEWRLLELKKKREQKHIDCLLTEAKNLHDAETIRRYVLEIQKRSHAKKP